MAGMEQLAIYTFPILGYAVFLLLPLIHAIPVTALAGFLLLPPTYLFNLPFLPGINKPNVIAVTLVVLAAAFAPRPGRPDRSLPGGDPRAQAAMLPGLLPQVWWARLCLLLLVVGPVGTVLTNTDPISADGGRAGLGPRDIGNELQQAIMLILPLLVARKFLGSAEGQRAVLLVLGCAGLVYSLPTLAEVRLSPQLHEWVYGGFQHSWIQHKRGDGFRPIVFTRHALELALFLCLAMLALLGCLRASEGRRRLLYAGGALYLAAVLVLAKSLGPLLVGLAVAPVILIFGLRVQLVFAALVGIFILVYPLASASGIKPFEPVAKVVETFDRSRAGSLRARLEQEERMAAHAAERPVFGWGSHGRAIVGGLWRVQNRARDGFWLIRFGEGGVVGYVGLMGLLAIPLIALAGVGLRHRLEAPTGALAVVLAANLVDLIPNAGLTVVTMILAGALIGRLEHVRAGLGEAIGGTAAGTASGRARGRAPGMPAPPAIPRAARAGAAGEHVAGGGGPEHGGSPLAVRDPPPQRPERPGLAGAVRYSRFPPRTAPPRRI